MIICQLCQRECTSKRALSQHIRQTHKNITLKQYYDKFLRKENEGICTICGKETSFTRWYYLKHCSKKCAHDDPSKMEKIRQTSRKKYGTMYPSQTTEVQIKKRKTCKEKYGYDNPSKIKKFQDKKIQTSINRYGTIHPAQTKEFQDKKNLTCKEKYGYENVMHNDFISQKQRKGSFQKKKYTLPSGKEITILGEEPAFLNYIFTNNLLKEDDIDYNPKKIKYLIDDKDHYYFPDFYIISLNLIVEVKSSYILSIQENTDIKISATKDLGYNYIMILDKKYDEFKLLTEKGIKV